MTTFAISHHREADGSISLSCHASNGVTVFADMGLPADTHGEYAHWADWNGYAAPADFQATIEALVEAHDFDQK